MTTHVQSRCTHCGVKYAYQGSGHGCLNILNDAKHCPICKQAIVDALARVPVLWEQAWVPTSEVNLATLLEWERLNLEEATQRNGGLVIRRLSVPLFNLDTGESTRQGFVKERSTGQPREFHYQYWPGREVEARITMKVDREIATGRTIPWR